MTPRPTRELTNCIDRWATSLVYRGQHLSTHHSDGWSFGSTDDREGCHHSLFSLWPREVRLSTVVKSRILARGADKETHVFGSARDSQHVECLIIIHRLTRWRRTSLKAFFHSRCLEKFMMSQRLLSNHWTLPRIYIPILINTGNSSGHRNWRFQIQSRSLPDTIIGNFILVIQNISTVSTSLL